MKKRIGTTLLGITSGFLSLLRVFCIVLTYTADVIGIIWLLSLGKWDLALGVPLYPIILICFAPFAIFLFGFPLCAVMTTLKGWDRPGKWAFAELADKLEPLNWSIIALLWSACVFWVFIYQETQLTALRLGHEMSITWPFRFVAYANATRLLGMVSKEAKEKYNIQDLILCNQVACLGLFLFPNLFHTQFLGLLVIQAVIMAGYMLLIRVEHYLASLHGKVSQGNPKGVLVSG